MTSESPLPLEQSLFIATPNAIHLRSQLATKTLFQCETDDGLVNARASKDNSSLFAVADGQVVILHDVTCGKDKKYKLKNGDVWHA
jgi:membrane-bound inhibitor of C-type lysozyme